MLHNLKILCPLISTYTSNCYAILTTLFIIGKGEIISNEQTTHVNGTSNYHEGLINASFFT